MDLMQRIKSTNGIDIRDSAHVRVPAGEIRAALAEVERLAQDRRDRFAELGRRVAIWTACSIGAVMAISALGDDGTPTEVSA